MDNKPLDRPKGSMMQMNEVVEESRELFRLRPDLYNKLVGDILNTVDKFGDTQQLRAQVVKVLSGHIVPDHPHTRKGEA